MRSFKRFPLVTVRSANLSKGVLKRLCWFDYYLANDENVSLTCRHFDISRDTFYLWKVRFNPSNLKTLADNLKTRTPYNLRQMTTSREVIEVGLGINHYFNHPHTPKMNGRAERLIQTAEYEFFNYQEDLIDDLDEINLRCEIFNDKYNNRRYHKAIHYQTPSQYVKSYLEQKGEVYVI